MPPGSRRQILSTHRPPYLPDEAECVRAMHLLNDGYAELAHRYPERIASYVMLPLPHIDASLREMERGLDELGCVGVNMNISCLGRSIAEPDFEPLYAEMNRRGAILFVHPSVTGVCSPVINDWGFRAAIGNSVEDAMFVAHMIARQIPHRYPNIRFIVPHLGGPIPMLLNRLDKQGVRDLGGLAELPSVTARRFWYDTVCYGSKAAFTCACEAFGAAEAGDRQRLSGVAGLRGVPGDVRVHRADRVAGVRSSTGSCTTMRRSCSASGTDAATLLGDHSRRSVEIECLNGHQDPRRIEADFARHENLCSNLVVCHARVANDALLFRPDDQVMLHRRQLEIRM